MLDHYAEDGNDTGRETEILTGMAATGAQVMMFSTGRGAPQGFPGFEKSNRTEEL